MKKFVVLFLLLGFVAGLLYACGGGGSSSSSSEVSVSGTVRLSGTTNQ